MFNGLSIIAPRIDVGSQPYLTLKEIHADTVAIIPFGFIWKWYIDEGTQERRPETDYTPQAKQAFYTIKKLYQTN
jgi:hypothetical protein